MNSSLRASPCVPSQQTGRPVLAVWLGSMPESNGRMNYTASLFREGGSIHMDGFCFARSEYPDRVRYEADRMRWVIGERAERPNILDYDADLHSGYVAPPASQQAATSADTPPGTQASLEAGVNPLPHPSSPQGEADVTDVKSVPFHITPEMAYELESNIMPCTPPSAVHAANWQTAWEKCLAAAPAPTVSGGEGWEELERSIRAEIVGADEDGSGYRDREDAAYYNGKVAAFEECLALIAVARGGFSARVSEDEK